MKSTAQVILLVTFASLSTAYPTLADNDPEYGNKFEGDIILSTEQWINILTGGRNGLIDESYRWPERKVFYKIYDGQFDAAHENYIIRGMQHLEEASCIRFHEANENTTAYINITSLDKGCFSQVGYTGGVQGMNLEISKLDTGCFRLGTIVHEFLHALGFYHQHSASDRDEFVTIVFENIQDKKKDNFNIYNSSIVDDFGVPYDYGSVMHYGPTAFSKNGKPTIVPHDPTAEIGQRRAMSTRDIIKLNLMYKCPIPSARIEQFAMALCDKYRKNMYQMW